MPDNKEMATMQNATHLNLIDRIDEKTGASVAMWAGVHAAPIEWAAMAKPSDDRLPMAGVWYRATDGSGDQCVVMDKDVATQMTIITRTGGHMATLTFTEFAAAWELV